MSYSTTQQEPMVELTNIYKSFSSNMVLKGVNLSLYPGDVMALVGGNGAGKSTLMKILTGLYCPDEGDIMLNGKSVTFTSPADAHKNGIYLVPQEPLLFPNMSVFENITIGFDGQGDLRGKVEKLLSELGWKIDLDDIAGKLTIADQQLVEIMRGFLREAKILILDEPTSTLTFGEIESLFTSIKKFQKQGIGMFYITHRLNEIFEIANKVAILRDGCITVSGNVKDFTKDMLIQGLLPPEGCNVQPVAKKESKVKKVEDEVSIKDKKPVLEALNVSGDGFNDLSFQLYPGEILGIAGVVGAGRTEMAEAMFGIRPILKGEVLLDGKSIKGKNITQRIKAGLNYLPEDRYLNGIFGISSVRNNITSTVSKKFSSLFINASKEKDFSDEFVKNFRIKITDLNQEVKSLSGGNQQKVVIAKTLATGPKVIILDEPTRGIDASARCDIYNIIHELKEKGLGVIIISSDFEEIVELSDRVLIMYNGAIYDELKKDRISIDAVTALSFGVKTEEVLTHE